ncbi:hypothetical protein LTR59_007544 [Friedmanniomyces endolithicus]|nr:hypothetical protein LTR94_006595 [Friedmanniomyces endolithicus]KAK0795149.1 hypothetical protein LTR59_007544 [Friedmanniomyces endolithicus]KAK0802027.1 hypothetical protein LTR38_006602 [Friedmanniomyces endolithicus]KAK0820754.1 hypothetical protein LTR75_001340 [Friedmanniomyces endolithicus]KAK0846540.1 hypothetical protein LTR03_006816 [Friedmanniomyces endolithicus]
MDVDHDVTNLGPNAASSNHVAVNSQYGALSGEDDHDGEYQRLDTQRGQHTGTNPAIALSPLTPNRIAFSSLDQVHFRDLDTGFRVNALPGTGRVVSTIAWSSRHSGLLASGTIDGNVCLWDVASSNAPLSQLRFSTAICSHISFSPLNDDLATAHGGLITVLSHTQPHNSIRTINTGTALVTHLTWHPSITGKLLSVSAANIIRIWKVPEAAAVGAQLSFDEESDEESVFGEPDGLQMQTSPIAQLELGGLVASADWIGEHGIYVALPFRSELRVYILGADWATVHEVWRATMKFNPQCVIARSVNGSVSLTAIARGGSQLYQVPSTVLGSVGGITQSSLPRDAVPETPLQLAEHPTPVPAISSGFEPVYGETQKPLLPSKHESTVTTDSMPRTPRMRPISIAQLRAELGSFPKSSKQLQKRRGVGSSLYVAKCSAFTAAANGPESPISPASRALTSSLELPKTREDDENDSPMPFLSPNIPARKPSPNTAPVLEDVKDLPTLHSSSFDSLPSTVGQDSDSDDETFHGGMRNSTTFMPGGVNVPLPKACGALFAPNGQLLTFFPPKPRPPGVSDDRTPPAERTEHSNQGHRIAQLFPTFGNLIAVRRILGGGTDDEESLNESDVDSASESYELPEFAKHPSSSQIQTGWSNHTSPTKAAFVGQDLRKIVVSVHELDLLAPSRRPAAHLYRNICERGETESGLCRHNADVAEDAGLGDTASLWRLMALLLEDKVPLSLMAAAGPDTDILLLARHAGSLPQSQPGTDPFDLPAHAGPCGKLRWADSPLGAAFLVRECFQWAERRADVQLLALLSAVLIEVEDNMAARNTTASQSTLSPAPSHVNHVSPSAQSKGLGSRPIPLLRNESDPSGLVYASPTKLRRSPEAFSRAPSHSLISQIDSTSSTPPLSLPLSRDTSRLSGSASPENHRSSFSAAARQYAQSFGERFAAYGTSPPLKTSTSPNLNELSTSLSPAAGGSWSKSVSFASTASTTRESQLSRSYTSRQDMDGYDSDKTIDDSSLPHTPKFGVGPVVLHLPNSDMFTDDVAGGSATLPLIPRDLATKAVSWRAYYAEQLRCWGLHIQAAELEKAAGATTTSDVSSKPYIPAVSFAPVPRQRKPSCTICFTLISRLAQICPACLHTTHARCLAEYRATLSEDEVTFECPTGCGCSCDRLPYEHQELAVVKLDGSEVQKKVVRKKISYTDPRRWRARMEGESW